MSAKPVVAILGLGLIGGSLGMVLRKKKWASKVIGFGRAQSKLHLALKLRACHEITTDYHRVKDADIIVIATPVQTIKSLCIKIAPFLKKDSVVTDCGSAKESVVTEAEKSIPSLSSFVGSHPMAGSEKTGVKEARADLFKNSICAITPTNHTRHASVLLISNMWKNAGAKPIYLSPEEHDKIVAITSHMPHLMATMIMAMYLKEWKKDKRIEYCVATGFKSVTRIAAGDSVIWRDILLANRTNIVALINDFEAHLTNWKRLLTIGHGESIRKELEKMKKAREALN